MAKKGPEPIGVLVIEQLQALLQELEKQKYYAAMGGRVEDLRRFNQATQEMEKVLETLGAPTSS